MSGIKTILELSIVIVQKAKHLNSRNQNVHKYLKEYIFKKKRKINTNNGCMINVDFLLRSPPTVAS